MFLRVAVGLIALGAGSRMLQAQERPNLSLPRDQGDIQYHFQLRASRTGSALRDLAGSQVSGGGGFMAMLGEMPLRLRFRMDGDVFPATSGRQTVRTAGLGAEAVYLFPPMDRLEPFVSLGPAFQRWEIGTDSAPDTPKRSFNKAAGRLEAGLWFRERVCISLGLLCGKLENGHSTSNPYAAVTFRF